MTERYTRLAPSADDSAHSLSATASGGGSGVCSDERVGRDGFLVKSDGLDFSAILLSGSMQWAHDDSLLPIAKPTRTYIARNQPYKPVTIFWNWAPRDANPLAGQVQDLVEAGYVRALSLSWQPISWKYSDDPERPGGIDFLAADAIEVSFVPSPALPTALIDAQRSRSIDTRPLREWCESALDRPNYRGIARPELESLYRAVASPLRSGSRWSSRAAREARLRENAQGYRQRQERLERARQIIANGALDAAGLSRDQTSGDGQVKNTPNVIKTARRHVSRALKRHQDMAAHHDEFGAGVKELRSIHRALTSTLKELGYRSSRASSKPDPLDDLERCMSKLAASHVDARDACDSASDALDEAFESLADGTESDEPTQERAGARLQ